VPATSKAQQQFMAIAEHEPSKLRGKKPNMTHQQLHDFAATPSKNLPEHAPKHDGSGGQPAAYYGSAAPGAYDGCHYDGNGGCSCGQIKR